MQLRTRNTFYGPRSYTENRMASSGITTSFLCITTKMRVVPYTLQQYTDSRVLHRSARGLRHPLQKVHADVRLAICAPCGGLFLCTTELACHCCHLGFLP